MVTCTTPPFRAAVRLNSGVRCHGRFILFSIRSSSSDRELAFLSLDGDHFTVELRGSALQATHAVWAYTDAKGLANLFARLGSYERPWSSEERWESLEGEFSLSARCSPLGHVDFSVHLHGSQGAPEEWQLTAVLTTELGQLPKIAASASGFFSGT